MEQLFDINVNQYVKEKDFHIYTASSIQNPKDNSLMFLMKKCMHQKSQLEKVKECLIFWPEDVEPPKEMKQHAFYLCKEPRKEYSNFFVKHKIESLPKKETGKMVNGAFIADGAEIGEGVTIFPFAYIGENVKIGNNAFIGSGVKLIGNIEIGDNVVIRENTVIGADGLTTDRADDGTAVTMPQFGGVIIENDVKIGANVVIARGAIDNTIIRTGAKIDNCCFISHNVVVGRDTFIVGESIMFGSSSTGDRAYISGNSTIRNGIRIGEDAFIGMGSVVVKNVDDGTVVKGNPAR